MHVTKGNVDETTPEGETDSILAARLNVTDEDFLNKCEAVDYLLKIGASVNNKDKEGRTALHWAAVTNHVPVIKSLIEHEADINAEDNMVSISFIFGMSHVLVIKIKSCTCLCEICPFLSLSLG